MIAVTSSAFADDISGTISGRVLSPDGEPIQGAAVTLPDYGDGLPISETETAADGSFSLVLKEDGERTFHRRSPALRIEADGYAATYVDDRHLTVFADLDKHLGDIRLDCGCAYKGRVIDKQGKPISRATVLCGAYRHYLGHTVDTIGQEQRATTDSDGRFETPTIPLGSPYVYVQSEGFLQGVVDRKAFDSYSPDGELPDLELDRDKPIHGRVKDEHGDPVSNAEVRASGITTHTDEEGRFVLSGFGEDAHFQLQIPVDGYAFVNWGVTATEDGFEYVEVHKYPHDASLDAAAYKKAVEAVTVRVPKLEVRLKREAQVSGRVIDTESGLPVALSRIVLCTFTRRKDGEVVLNGCRNSQFQQPEPGVFQLAYTYPSEYHLTLSADGYEDAEAFTPPVTSLEKIEGIVVKMKRKNGSEDNADAFKQRIYGTAKEDGTLIRDARVALWRLPRKSNAVNASIIRGRTTAGDGFVFQSQMLSDGQFSLDVPYQDDNWYLMVESPKGVVALDGPIGVAKGEAKEVEIEFRKPGAIRGSVTNHSSLQCGPLWVVAFSELGVQYETRVDADGNYAIDNVFPGQYGLKAGCDAMLDSEVPDTSDRNLGIEARLERFRKTSAPWSRAIRVMVQEGSIADGLKLEFKR